MGKIFKVFSSSKLSLFSTTEASSCRPGGHTCGAVLGPLEGWKFGQRGLAMSLKWTGMLTVNYICTLYKSIVLFFAGEYRLLITFWTAKATKMGSLCIMEDAGVECNPCGFYVDLPRNNPKHLTHCWWKKSYTTWDVWNLVNNGINYQPQLVS